MIGTLPYAAYPSSLATISGNAIAQDWQVRDAAQTVRASFPGLSFPASATLTQLNQIKDNLIDAAIAQDSAGDPLALLDALFTQNFGLTR